MTCLKTKETYTLVKELDFYKPLAEIFDNFYKKENSVFLDSSLKNEKGRFSIIGINSYLNLRVSNDKLFINDKPSEYRFEKFLKKYLEDNFEKNSTDLPLISGAAGYISYDYGLKMEKIKSKHCFNKEIIPDVIFNFYDNFVIEDIENHKIYITACGKKQEPEKSIEEIEKIIADSENFKSIKNKYETEINSDFKKEDYKKAINKIINYITEGDVYITNMTQQFKIKSRKNPYAVFKYLRKNNPSPFGGYLKYNDFEIISASPERFLKVENRKVNTRPIKGTRPRGRDREEDNLMKEELKNSEKDKSELLMIVDLERNDLNKVCIPGSVKVDELFELEEYATVFHLVSDISGILKEGKNAADLIKAAFPGGSITGAPKIRAMEIIDETEHSQRGIYTGSLGYISLNGNCDFNIIIRTALHKDDTYYIGAGGGITCESETEFEYEETLQKAKALIDAISE